MGERAPNRLAGRRVGTAEDARVRDPRDSYSDPEFFGAIDPEELSRFLTREDELRERELHLVAVANREIAPHFDFDPPTRPALAVLPRMLADLL